MTTQQGTFSSSKGWCKGLTYTFRSLLSVVHGMLKKKKKTQYFKLLLQRLHSGKSKTNIKGEIAIKKEGSYLTEQRKWTSAFGIQFYLLNMKVLHKPSKGLAKGLISNTILLKVLSSSTWNFKNPFATIKAKWNFIWE